ncbi:alpha/beta fold hydrolase [Cupriavidus necator]|uniref:alpha/beta fold hydrolase n=1 Tax=Cupriavidus necator TaxID=106590 RepID=UPI002785625D|nr:alpha/beta fold hydrolase [Cupriavidus necator]MDQ0141200.1 pimeloyl-ACP methyl ester carboxylesterase [Cupriavidus necator]
MTLYFRPQRYTTLSLQTGDAVLAADRLEVDGRAECLFLHGADHAGKSRLMPLRKALADLGCGSIAFDYSGHGQSPDIVPRSLSRRYVETVAALSLFRSDEPRVIVGISMSGEIAVRLAGDPKHGVRGLVTLVGAVYAPEAFSVPFGTEFTRILRQPGSWERSDAFSIVSQFRGHLTVVQAENDRVIPHQIGERLVLSAGLAESAQRVVLPDIGHALTSAFEASPALVQSLASLLKASVDRAKH